MKCENNQNYAGDPVKNMEIQENDVEKPGKTSKTFLEYVKSVFTFFTVEPFLFCYLLPNTIVSIAAQQFNMEKACLVDLNYSQVICNQIVSGEANDNITEKALDSAQILVADLNAWKQPLQSFLPAVLILFVGAWSDRTGNRKALMLVPILGEFTCTILMILATYFWLDWPLYVTGLIESIPTALSGGLSIALMGSYSYVADVTTTESRTFRLGLVAVIVLFAAPIGLSISGLLVQSVGYYGTFGISIVLYIIGFTHTYFRIHNIRNTKTIGNFKERVIIFFHPRNILDTISIIFTKGKKRIIKIFLIIFAHIILIGPGIGESELFYLYVLKKFNMDVVEFSLFQTYMILMSIAGTAIAVTVFSKLMQMHDATIGIIATACKTVSNLVYGLAPTKKWFYAGPAFDFFGNTGVTAIRSLGTKVVDVDEVAKMCSLIGFVEALVPLVYAPIYNKLYTKTVETFIGAFYILGAIMTVPAFAIFIAIFIMHKREEKNIVKNVETKEMYARENAITIL